MVIVPTLGESVLVEQTIIERTLVGAFWQKTILARHFCGILTSFHVTGRVCKLDATLQLRWNRSSTLIVDYCGFQNMLDLLGMAYCESSKDLMPNHTFCTFIVFQKKILTKNWRPSPPHLWKKLGLPCLSNLIDPWTRMSCCPKGSIRYT